MAFIAFWAGIVVLGAVAAWTGHMSRAQAEQTIRLGIEKGAITDAQQIALLRRPAGLSWSQRLSVFGVLALFASAGMALLGSILAGSAPEPPTPIFALAAFVAILALGLLVCARVVRGVRRAD